MAKSKYGPSRADKVSKAWKNITDARNKFGFPEFATPQEIHQQWNITYGVPHNVIDTLRRDAQLVYDGMGGRMPWSQAPKPKEATNGGK